MSNKTHKHNCRRCKKPFECDGTYVRNYDGFPEAICDLYHEHSLNLCEECVTEQQTQETLTTINCPLCGETVKQVSSATLNLALWQHMNWVCVKRPEAHS